MNKYVIAFLYLGEGELKQEIVEAPTKFEAMVFYLGWEQDEIEKSNGSLDYVYEVVTSQSSYINALEINHERTSRKGGGLQNQVAGFDSQARVQ